MPPTSDYIFADKDCRHCLTGGEKGRVNTVKVIKGPSINAGRAEEITAMCGKDILSNVLVSCYFTKRREERGEYPD